MTEREAKTGQFEAWLRTVAVYGAPDASSPAGKWMLAAWQASRKQALEEACDIAAEHGKTTELWMALRSLTSHTGGKE